MPCNSQLILHDPNVYCREQRVLFNLNYRDSLQSALIYFVKERGLILSLYSSSIASIPQKEMDIFFFGIFTKPETVGIYRMAKNFTVALWAIVDGLVLLLSRNNQIE